MKRLLAALLSAAALHLATAPVARADALPSPDNMSWQYNWEPSTQGLTTPDNPTAGVQLTNEQQKTAVGSSDIVATNLRVFSVADAATPDNFKGKGQYHLTLTLSTQEDTGKKDKNGKEIFKTFTGKLTFYGALDGTFSAKSANVKNTFANPGVDEGTSAPLSLNLGHYTFTVALIAYTPPGPPEQSNSGSISAHVEVSSLQPAGVPEPGTMVLTGLGLSCLGGAAWRKRRLKR